MKQEILDEVAKGDIGHALQLLIAYVELDGQHPKLSTAARLLQTEYNAHHEKELQGVTSSEENRLALNRTGKGILDVIQAYDSGNNDQSSASLSPKKLNLWLVVIPLLIIVGIGIGIYINQLSYASKTPSKNPVDTLSEASTKPLGISCPIFSPNAPYKVTVLPFKALSTEQIAVQTQIVEEFGKNLLTDNPSMRMVGLVNNFDVNRRYPDFPFADSLQKACGADMIVWGNYLNEKKINISFYCPLFQAEDRQTIDSLIQKRDQGEFTAGIQVAVRLLAARLYLAKGEPNKAIPIAQNVQKSADKTGSKAAKSMATITLAQAYIRTGQPEKAIQQYDTILVRDPNHPLALNNKAVLSVKLKHIEALDDVKKAIKVNPSPGLQLLESDEYQRLGDSQNALKSLKKASKIAPDNIDVQRRIQDFPNEILNEKSQMTKKGGFLKKIKQD